MLILQRKAGQTLQIGGEISVTVLSVEDGRVRLAIDAPKSILVLRGELLRAAESNKEAAGQQGQVLELLDALGQTPGGGS